MNRELKKLSIIIPAYNEAATCLYISKHRFSLFKGVND